MQLKIRTIEEKDIESMINLVHEAWFKGVYEEIKFEKAAAAISLNKALYNSSHGRVAEVEGQILGMVLSKIAKEEPIYRKFQTNTIENLIELSKHGQDKEMKRLIDTFEAERKIYKSLFDKVEENYDASIEYIAVSAKARGKGVGRSLIYEVIQELIEKDCKNLYLFTDSDCNYQFYDCLNFKRIASGSIELPTKNGSRNREEYMYGYHFQ